MTLSKEAFQGFKIARWILANAIKKNPGVSAKDAMALLDDKIMQHLRQE